MHQWSLAPGPYENWMGYNNGTNPTPSYWAHVGYIPVLFLSSLILMIDDRIYINTVLSTHWRLSFCVSNLYGSFTFVEIFPRLGKKYIFHWFLDFCIWSLKIFLLTLVLPIGVLTLGILQAYLHVSFSMLASMELTLLRATELMLVTLQ